ncbi:MAG: hypothetical protein AB8B97_17705 [Granulosicoccus sp.]
MNTPKILSCKRQLRVGILPIAAALVLGACSSSSDDTAPATNRPANDDVSFDVPGLMVTGLSTRDERLPTNTGSTLHANVSLFRSDGFMPSGGGDASVSLLRYGNDITMQELMDFYAPVLDTCEIRDLNAVDGGTGGGTSSRVTGGISVTINSPGGTFVQLLQAEDDPGFYENIDILPGPIPEGATLSVPGDIFPNVAAYPLYEPTLPVRISPEAGRLQVADALAPFTWVPGPNVPGSYFKIVARGFDDDGNFVGFPVICDLVDDGEFSMPPEVLEFARNTTLNIDTRYERKIQRLDFVDGIAFHQATTVAE